MKIELHFSDEFLTINRISYQKYSGYTTMVYYEGMDGVEMPLCLSGWLSIPEILNQCMKVCVNNVSRETLEESEVN